MGNGDLRIFTVMVLFMVSNWCYFTIDHHIRYIHLLVVVLVGFEASKWRRIEKEK